jgi:hypothetical protein
MRPFTVSDLGPMLGKETHEANRWLARMLALRVFEQVRAERVTTYSLTRGGRELLSNLVYACEHMDPAEWRRRFHSLLSWVGPENPMGLVPINAQRWELNGNDDRQAVPF